MLNFPSAFSAKCEISNSYQEKMPYFPHVLATTFALILAAQLRGIETIFN